MKIALFRVVFVALALAISARAESPKLPIQKAVSLAQDALAAKGKQHEVYIQSIAIERGAVFKSDAVWIVKWSHTVPGTKEGSKEFGLEINMKGDVVHLIQGRTNKALISPH